MQNTELLDIEAELQALARRAYDLGRSDALRKIADAVNADRPDRLALTGPHGGASHGGASEGGASHGGAGGAAENQPEAAHENMSEAEPRVSNPPWWAWRVR